VPQVRDGSFASDLFERYQRSEQRWSVRSWRWW
jgi:transposase-like protein